MRTSTESKSHIHAENKRTPSGRAPTDDEDVAGDKDVAGEDKPSGERQSAVSARLRDGERPDIGVCPYDRSSVLADARQNKESLRSKGLREGRLRRSDRNEKRYTSVDAGALREDEARRAERFVDIEGITDRDNASPDASISHNNVKLERQTGSHAEIMSPEEQNEERQGSRQQTINDPTKIEDIVEPARFEDSGEPPLEARQTGNSGKSEENPFEEVDDRPPKPPGRSDDEPRRKHRDVEASEKHEEGLQQKGLRSADGEKEETDDRYKLPRDAATVFYGDTLEDNTTTAPYLAVPENFREEVIQWNRILGQHRGLMAFFQLVLFGAQAGERGGVVADRFTVRDLFGFEQWRDTPSAKIIGTYKTLIDPGLEVLPFNKSKRWAREIIGHGIPAHLVEMAERFQRFPDRFDNWVYLIDGRTANGANRREVTDSRIEEAQRIESAIAPPPALDKIQRYLHGRSTQLFHSVRSRVGDAIEYVDRNPEIFASQRDQSKEKKQQVARSQLTRIRQFPKPVYAPTDYSARLKSFGENQLLTLKSAVRPKLYSECDVELDLSKAHLAIFAKLGREAELDVSVIEEHLRWHRAGKIDLWSELADEVDVPGEEAARKAVKRLYAGVYGGSADEVLRQVSNRYDDLAAGPHPGWDPFRPIMTHPLFKAIMRVQRGLKQAIKQGGGMPDASGQFRSLSDFESRKNPASSVLSYVATTYELKLIEAAFDAAIEEEQWAEEKKSRSPRFQIWLLQYDGFTMRVHRRREVNRWVEHLKGEVAQRAKGLDIITTLERA